jgi:hypothetical protein
MTSHLRFQAALALTLAGALVAGADEQVFAPGTAQQNAVVVSTGPNGRCDTQAANGDIQLAQIGGGTPFRNAVRCGTNLIVETTAAGDDRQLIAVGRTCANANTAVIDTGEDGIGNTAATGDDQQVVAVGFAPSNTPCVIAGGNGIADTPDPVASDDVRVLPFGTAAPNTPAIRCGANLVADTTANNVNPLGDDVQLIPLGGACPAADTPVVGSGPNGIADTRAGGVDLTIAPIKPVKLVVGRNRARSSRGVTVIVSNREFGPNAPGSRTFSIRAVGGSCPSGTVSQIDADALTPGLQATAAVPRGGRIKASFEVTARLEDWTTVDLNAPGRCQIVVEVVATDTAPALDDMGVTANNETSVTLEVNDRNDQ